MGWRFPIHTKDTRWALYAAKNYRVYQQLIYLDIFRLRAIAPAATVTTQSMSTN